MKHALRHFLATISYRGNKYLVNYNSDFPTYQANPDMRTPEQILNHINGLLMYTRSFLDDVENTYPPQDSFENEVFRFHKEIVSLDKAITTTGIEDQVVFDKILQGPFADIMLHIGELSMIRKIINDPADDYENYMNAPIYTIE